REGQESEPGYYEELVTDPRFDLSGPRRVTGDPSNLMGTDSPKVMADIFDTFDRSGLRRVAAGELDEQPAISAHKGTLRRVFPESFNENTPSFWHQDGAFLGDVRALNVWLALSRCGDVAPGLDLVPQRIDHIVPTGTEGAVFDWSVSRTVVEEE